MNLKGMLSFKMPHTFRHPLNTLLIVFGFLAAFTDSVVGGGGLITLPALLFTGLNPAAAVATNKLAGTMGSLTSTLMFYRSGKLDLTSLYKLFPLVFIGLCSFTVYCCNLFIISEKYI